MKRMIIALVAMFMMTFTTASAMSYEQARQQALFLTDKMAYAHSSKCRRKSLRIPHRKSANT